MMSLKVFPLVLSITALCSATYAPRPTWPDPCKDKPCPDDSKCSSYYGTYKCTCNSHDQYWDKTANKCINPCPAGSTYHPPTYHGTYTCTCDNHDQYFDKTTQKCIDPCDPSPCPSDATCRRTHYQYNWWANKQNKVKYECCCEKGYTYNKDTNSCDDVNECEKCYDACSRKSRPHTTCINTPGSYECSCEAGYMLVACAYPYLYYKRSGGGWGGYGYGGYGRYGYSGYHCGAPSKPEHWPQFICKKIEDPCSDPNVNCPSNSQCVNDPSASGGYRCQCDDGYTGDNCDDIDECTDNTANDCEQTCSNTVGSFTCGCNPGYTLNANGKTCDDIDECTDNTANDCEQTCSNTVGSFTCGCNPGYTLNADGKNCDDIDECTDNTANDCEQTCTNTMGSFICDCAPGYTLNADGVNCDDIDECTENIHGCAQTCTNTLGSFTCGCHPGYRLNVDGKNCDDIDECAEDPGRCPDHSTCVNTIGSAECQCNVGFEGAGGLVPCNDINECDEPSTCFNLGLTNPDRRKCVNTVGSFMCGCNKYWTGLDCETDVDECTNDITSEQACGFNTICTNKIGQAPDCACKAGYTPSTDINRRGCVDIDECQDPAVSNCPQYSKCHNEPGTFRCVCEAGFAGPDGGPCVDIDECQVADGCGTPDTSTCENTVGSFVCGCKGGYMKDPNDAFGSCMDIDECATDAANMQCTDTGSNFVCQNTMGSFFCNCEGGYEKKGDLCEDINECANSPCDPNQTCTNTPPGSFTCN